MSDLTTKERRKLETYFEMGGGYFLDFTNNSLAQFIAESVDIELYSDKYEIGSGSKGNRMRAIWDLESNQLVGKLIRDIIEDDDDKKLLYPHHKDRNQELKRHCLQIAARLENSNSPVVHPTVNQPEAARAFPPVQRNVPANRPSAVGIFPPVQQPFSQPVTQQPPVYSKPIRNKNKVFIVHGHDDLAKEQLARFVTQVGLEPIILHEQASSSKTIIEKIEKYADEVCFAIVLYTPCDQGSKIGLVELSPRARQNVVFEHGYFIGKLGRENVTAIIKGDLEKPNDISGVVYETLDDAGAWKFKLAKEMKTSGCEIDMNKII
jgi:predicted nucleotide-binding protein